MKTREQTKASIRRKSAAILKERARVRRTVLSAAACVVLALAVSGGLARLRRQAPAASERGADIAVGAYGGGVDDGLTCGDDDGGTDTELTKDAPRRGVDSVTSDLCTVYNANYQQADSMTVSAKPEKKKVSLSAQNPDEKAVIDAMGEWLSGLETQSADERKDSDTLYIIERRFGNHVTKAYVRGRQIRFDEGDWLTFSEDARREFDRLIQDIYDEAE